MKASHFIIPAVFTLASSFALADHHEAKEFSEVDKNNDGLLSLSEANEAFPSLELTSGAPSSSRAGANTDGDAMLTRDHVKRALPDVAFEEGDARGPITEKEYAIIVVEVEKQNMAANAGSGSTGAAAASSTRAGSDSSSARAERNDNELNVGHEDGDVGAASSTRSSTGAAASSTRGAADARSASEVDSPAANTRINRNTNSTAQPGASNAAIDTNDAADRENEADDDRDDRTNR